MVIFATMLSPMSYLYQIKNSSINRAATALDNANDISLQGNRTSHGTCITFLTARKSTKPLLDLLSLNNNLSAEHGAKVRKLHTARSECVM